MSPSGHGRSIRRTSFTLLVAAAVFGPCAAAAAINVPLTIQEALYPGSIAGVTRTGDPVTVGVPLPDDPTAGVVDVAQLTLTGANVGQFRVLGRWPSGRIKWVLIDTQASMAAGGRNTSIALTDGGTGNFGGPNLAVDNGTTISVSTGAATFIVRKANFNVLDQVQVGGVTLLASGRSPGLVVTGPPPGQTTCPPCTTLYSSANDAASTAVIEENGPAKAVIRADGSHVDASGNVYMRFTVRMYFYFGKSFVKVTSTLRNADYGASNTFATAYKGHQGYELRLAPTLSGTPGYAFANHTATPTTGTLGASDSVYLYQGQSQQMKWQDWCGWGCVPFTADTGYQIVKNGAPVFSGSDTQPVPGWADLSGGNGAGVSIGIYQMSAYWPKSLEFNAGGSDIRIGIWPRQNSQPYYQSWPQWSTHDLFLNFHAATLASPANDFLRFQHYLVARAPIAHYNTTKVFPYPLVDPVSEDRFYTSTATAAVPALGASRGCCIQDFGTTSPQWPLAVFRYYAWGAGGGANQTEFRWAYLLNFLTRGMTGRYLFAAHFYRFQAESTWPHSDGFNWRDRAGEYDGFGFPRAASANATLGVRNWLDQEHGHWYGMIDYYFLTGDETIRDALLDGPKDWFLNPNTYQNGQSGGLYNSRSIAVNLLGSARFSQFLAATGDPDGAAVLNEGVTDYTVQIKPELCVSGFPAGCTLGSPDGGPWTTQGVSRTRGVPWGASGTSGTWCGVTHAYRVNSSFQPSILIQGILELRNATGPAWTEYWNSLDLAYGIARWNLSENFVDDGSGRWDTNGFRFGLALDVPNKCTNPGETPEPDFQPTPTQTTAMTFLAKYLVDGTTDWATKFRINTQKDMAALGVGTSDFGEYQLATIINLLNTGVTAPLSNVPISGFSDNGGGNYTLSWTVPANAQSYRIKWGSKRIVDWIGFDPANNVFTGDPATTMPWFAASNIPNIPAPASAGSVQTIAIATAKSGLTAANFSVRAYVTTVGVSARPAPPSNLVVTSSTPSASSSSSTASSTTGSTTTATTSGGDVSWSMQPATATSPGYNGWLNLWYDPVAQQTILYGVGSDSTSIYSTDIFAYKASTNTWTRIGGTGSKTDVCPADTPTQPGDRHPVWQMAVDTRRNVLWLFGGVCMGINRQDMYFLRLNANPTQDTWQQVAPAHYPIANDSSAMVYDPDDDVLFLFGSDTAAQAHDNWVYCRTVENPTPGALTVAQAAAGCAAPDDWTQVNPANGIQPPGVAFSGMVYDPLTKKMIQFGGSTGGGIAQNQTWAYDVPTRTWTQKALQTSPPPVYAGPIVPQPALAYNSATHQILYHQTSNTGAPADWSYDPVTDTWTKLGSSGSGPVVDAYMTYDPSINALIAFSRNPSTGQPDVWKAVLAR